MPDWKEVPATDELRSNGVRAWVKPLTGGKHLTAFVGREPDSKGHPWWHLSVSLRDNFSLVTSPVSHAMLADARRALTKPDILMCEMYPPLDRWQPGDETEHVRHLWEIPIDLWD